MQAPQQQGVHSNPVSSLPNADDWFLCDSTLPEHILLSRLCQYDVTRRMLSQHLELSHPENGESPFIARDTSPASNHARSRSRPSSRSAVGRGSRSSSRAPHPEGVDEDVYVECPLKCGEAVHIRELDDHIDLHDMEAQDSDENDRPSSSKCFSPAPSRRRSTSLGPPRETPSNHPSNYRSGELLSVPNDITNSSRKHKDESTLRSLQELFLGPAPRKTRPTESKAKQSGSIKRLGVGLHPPDRNRADS